MDAFEKLKTSIKNCFYPNKSSKQNSNKGDIEDSSLCSLLDYQERQKYKFKFENNMRNEIDSLRLSLIPPIYFTINISLYLILFYLKLKNNITLNNDYIFNKITFPGFFELYKVNTLIFHLYYSISSILGFIITVIIFNTLKQKVEASKAKTILNSLILYILLFFGLIYNMGTLVVSFIPYATDYYNFDDQKTTLFYQAIFINLQFCLSIFGLFSLIISLNPKIESKKKNNFWLALKLIVFSYLLILTILYLMILLNSYNMVNIFNNPNYVKKHFELSLCILPYSISFLSNLFVLSFYNEMNSVYASLNNS